MPQRIRFFGPSLALAVLLAFSPSDASAQICVGVPGASGQSAVAGSIGFASGVNIFGAQFHHHMAGNPLTLRARLEHWNPDFGDSENRFGAGVAYDLTGAVEAFPDEMGFCAVGDIIFGRSDGVNLWEIPVGVGFGGSFPVGDNGDIVIVPFAVPAIYHTRASFEGFSVSSTDLDMILGATAIFTGFHAGIDLQHLFRTGSSYVTLRGGVTF